MHRLLLTFLLIPFLFSACQKKPYLEPPIQEPGWIVQPALDGKIGAVGSAQEHFKGKVAQRRLAISRALDELAQQSGVQVQNTVRRNERRAGMHTDSSTEFYTVQNSSNETVRAHIEETWTNPKTKEIYVWLVAD